MQCFVLFPEPKNVQRKRHACSYPNCGKDYPTNSMLNAHIRIAHTHEAKFPCPQTSENCVESFTTKLKCEAHIERVQNFKN